MPDSLQRVTVEDVWNVLSRAALPFCICPQTERTTLQQHLHNGAAAHSPQWPPPLECSLVMQLKGTVPWSFHRPSCSDSE